MNKRVYRLAIRSLAVVAVACGWLVGQGGHGWAASCPTVQITNRYTFVYGNLDVNGAPAGIDTLVTAVSPRGDIVGCFIVTTPGSYGLMYVFGEDTSVSPAIPGMRNNEVIVFRVNGLAAAPSPSQNWTNDKASHQVALTATVRMVYVPATAREYGADW